MQEKEEIVRVVQRGPVIDEYLWWAAASTVQLGWAFSVYRKGYAGASQLMPFKAFAVATLLVGGGASAATAYLRASGVHTVEDLKAVGANVRTRLGVRPRDS